MPIITIRNGKAAFSRTGASYDGEKQMGDLNQWPTFSDDSNDILLGSYGILSERSATLYHTYGPVKSAINKQTNYAIGPGLVFRSQPDFKTLGVSKVFAKDWGKDFQRIVNSYFVKLNFYEKQSILFRSALYSGDSLLFFERKDGAITDLIETLNNQIDWGYNIKSHTLGIKHDSLLRREGIRKTDGTDLSFQNSAGDQNVIQFYIKELGRQLRGYPLAYTIINLARNDDTHTDAITHRAVMEATMLLIFKGTGTDLPKQAKDMAKANKASKGGTVSSFFKNIKNYAKMGPGNAYQIQASEDIEIPDMKTPSNTYKDYKESMLNYVGMGTGTPPEVIASKYTSTFTAHKGALNDFIKSYMAKRRSFERNVMNVVVREIAKDAILQGFIEAPGFFDGGWMVQQAWLNGMYLGPIPGHINPFVEVKAQAEIVKQAFGLRSDFAAQYGHDWDSMITEYAEEADEYSKIPQDNKARAVFEQETLSGGNND